VPFARLVIVLALVVAVVLPASAGAAPRTAAPVVPSATPSSVKIVSVLGAASDVARRYWGAVPCGGQVTILAQRPALSGAAADTDAWVTFGSALGDNDLAAPASGYTACVVSLGRARWPTAGSMSADWDMLCLTMIHEMGHLLGHAHDTAPHSVMLAVFTDRSSVPALCRAARPVTR
jgi:hypothetical protein